VPPLAPGEALQGPWQSRGVTADLYQLPGKRTRLVGEWTAGPGAAPAQETDCR